MAGVLCGSVLSEREQMELVGLDKVKERLLCEGLPSWRTNSNLDFFLRIKHFLYSHDEWDLLHAQFAFLHRHHTTPANALGSFKDSGNHARKANILVYCSRKKELTGMLEWLLNEGSIDPNEPSQDEFQMTPLIFAIANELVRSTELLLNDHRVNPNIVDSDGYSAVMYAASRCQLSSLKLLRHRGCDLTLFHDLESNHGIKLRRNILHCCCEREGRLEVVRWILDEGSLDPSVPSEDKYHKTPLMIAAQHGFIEYVRLLLNDPRVNIQATNAKGYSALMLAARNDHLRIVLLLRDHGCDVTRMHDIRMGDESISKRNILHSCAERGSCESTMRWILESELIDVNQTTEDEYRVTPLMISVNVGDINGCRMLVNCERVDKDALDARGWSALMYAVVMDNLPMVRMFSDVGCDLTRMYRVKSYSDNIQGRNLLHICCEKGVSKEMVQWLLNEGSIDPNEPSEDDMQFRPLLIAAQCNQEECVRMLLNDDRVDMYATNTHGWTALMSAARHNHTSIVEIFRNHGFDLNRFHNLTSQSDCHISWNVLHLCAENAPSKDTLVWLLQEGSVDPNRRTQDSDLMTPLIIAAHKNNVESAKLLLSDPRVSVHLPDPQGRTALMIAAESSSVEMVSLLIENEADPTSEDESGAKAVDFARKKKNWEIVRMLEEVSKEDIMVI